MESTMHSRILLLILCVTCAGTTAGCGSMTKGTKKDSPWGALQFWKKGYQQPAKMAVMWSADVLTTAGQTPTRGFGGRIYFYNSRSQTIPVDGELVVHGFDETAKRVTGADPNLPDKRFRFTAEQFTEHFSEGDLGASYSVWIPWDNVDGIQKEITLVPTFRGSKGELVQGAPAKAVLPGKNSPVTTSATPVQTVAFQQASIPTVSGQLPIIGPTTEQKPGSMRTTTIQVPTTIGGRRSSQSNLPQTSPAIPLSGNATPATPAQAALEQARAQMIAEAFTAPQVAAQVAQPALNDWNRGPSTLSRTNTKFGNPWAAPTASFGGQPPQNLQATNYAPGQSPGMTPGAAPGGHTSMQHAAAIDENIGLPPGVQLSPRAKSW